MDEIFGRGKHNEASRKAGSRRTNTQNKRNKTKQRKQNKPCEGPNHSKERANSSQQKPRMSQHQSSSTKTSDKTLDYFAREGDDERRREKSGVAMKEKGNERQQTCKSHD